MDEKRKEIIIKEIKTWKDSGLIPKQYCDFLLTLYTGGNQELVDEKEKMSLFQKLQLFLPAVLLIVFLVIYFTNLFSVMQIIVGILFAAIILIMARNTKRWSLLLSYFYFFAAALLLYLLTVKVIVFFEASTIYMTVATLVHCLSWLFIGMKWRIHFFTAASVIGFLGLVLQLFDIF